MSLTVAVTGPTGEIGLALMAQLEREQAVGSVRGMARGRFDPAREGWQKSTYRRGDVLDRGAVAALLDDADVAVHLAFAIFGSHRHTRRVNLEGSRNVFEAARTAGVRRLVYASSVAAYGFHAVQPPAAHRGGPRARQPRLLLLGAEGRAGGAPGGGAGRQRGRALRPAALHRRRPARDDAGRAGRPQHPARRPAAGAATRARPPAAAGAGAARRRLAIQLVHHDDVAAALTAAVLGAGPPGAYNLAGEGVVGIADVAHALGWHSVRVPGAAVRVGAGLARRLAFVSPQLEWAAALRTPVVMDTAKARAELGWAPHHDAAGTLRETALSARTRGLLR